MNTIILTSIIVFIIVLLLFSCAGLIIFVKTIRARNSKEFIFNGHGKTDEPITTEKYKWIDQAREVYISSKDGIRLHGYEVESISYTKWVIFLHGYSGAASNMVPYMDHFLNRGYNALSIDLRGHGKSAGKYYGMGFLDADDVSSWIGYLKDEKNCQDCNLFGVSLGGATAIIAAAQENSIINYVVTDSAPSDMRKMYLRIMEPIFHRTLSKQLFIFISFFSSLFAKYSISNASAEKYVSRIKCPVLFIHGSDDRFVPIEMCMALYDKCNAIKDLYISKGSDHTQALNTNHAEYWTIVDSFLHKYQIH